MGYLITYLLLSAIGTPIALAILAQGARDDEALEKLMSETEPDAAPEQSDESITGPPEKETTMNKTLNVLGLILIQSVLIGTKFADAGQGPNTDNHRATTELQIHGAMKND